MKPEINITTVTLAAGDTFFNDNLENKFFFNSLINSKNNLFEDLGILNNYFLVSNKTIFKDNKNKKLIFEKNLINYGSLGSLIYFLNKIEKVPDLLLVNYLDKIIDLSDLEYLISSFKKTNLVMANIIKVKKEGFVESFAYNDKKYLFNGFLILNRITLEKIKKLSDIFFYYNIPYIFNSLEFKDSKFDVIQNKKPTKEVRDKIEVAKVLLGSKSKSLHSLRDIKTAEIPKFKTLLKNDLDYLDTKLKEFNNNIIIRSDSEDEDSFQESSAGKFLSIGPIDKTDKSKVLASIKKVFNSYSKYSSNSKVIIQDYVEDIQSSGVITTRVLQNAAPYYCISISFSQISDEVTAGISNNIKNIYVHKNVKKLEGSYKKYQKLLNLINELIEFTSYDLLDIEFATDKKNKIYLLQVRPLLVDSGRNDNKKALIKNIRGFQQLQNKTTNTYGSRTLFSNMSDWNPAEMLGESPDNLAITLYKTYITNDTWYKQRKEFGYRGEVSQNLMFNFGNKCYIDIRASLNSFLTKSLTIEECERIVDFQIQKLIKNPELHDKIEFEVANTSYLFGLEEKIKTEYKQILPNKSLLNWANDLKTLEKNHGKILTRNLNLINNFYIKLKPSLNFFDPKVVNLIKKNMAIPFSHHARLAFIYFSQLNHFVKKGVISEEEKQELLNNLNTISSLFTDDLHKIKNKQLSQKSFINKYGHIRPNNYDLRSKNIREQGKDFVDFLIDNLEEKSEIVTSSNKTLKNIQNFLKKDKYLQNYQNWYYMFKESIIAREKSKFMYSKAIDLTLNQLKNSNNLDKNRLHTLNFENFVNKEETIYENLIEDFELPDLITTSNDFLYFSNLNTKPNFIGQKSVKGKVHYVTQNKDFNCKNKIILLPSADPGWDWILNLPIKGMITKFGGPNSHMAIRAAEKNLTSVFGVGDDLFNEIKNSNILQIDPKNKKLYFN